MKALVGAVMTPEAAAWHAMQEAIAGECIDCTHLLPDPGVRVVPPPDAAPVCDQGPQTGAGSRHCPSCTCGEAA